jgi:hypothetical protein
MDDESIARGVLEPADLKFDVHRSSVHRRTIFAMRTDVPLA